MVAAVIQFFATRLCHKCEAPNDTVGHHCARCAENLAPLPLAFVQSTIAGSIRDLEKLMPEGPVRMALFQMRQAFDAITPRIRSPQIGVVRFDGEFWAHPEHSSECFGPFSTEERACAELIRQIADGRHVGQ